MFNFSEVNNLCLGYSVGIKGTGFGPKLSQQVMSTAYDIVKAGIEDPEFFELIPLFQENVGADRLSDMIATLVLKDIEQYTLRINRDLDITKEKYPLYGFDNDGFLINPFRNNRLLLVPIDILHALPVSESWEDIDSVVEKNRTLRNEINLDIENVWKKYTTQERKKYLRENVFKCPKSCKRVISEYKSEQISLFNPQYEINYLLEKLRQYIEREEINWTSVKDITSSYDVSVSILTVMKKWVELNKGWELIQNTDSRNREKVVQRFIHLAASSFAESNNVDISCEANEGRGAVDFKISRGLDKTVIEVKLSSNNKYLHGYKDQVIDYAKSEQTQKMIYVFINLGHPLKVKRLETVRDDLYDQGYTVPTLFIIDASKKESASI